MANQHLSYDPLDALMRPHQEGLYATTSQQTHSTPMSTTSLAASSPATSMSQEDAISARFQVAAVRSETRAMQQEFHQMLSVAQRRNQDCLFLKQSQKQQVEAMHGEMDWMRKRIQNLEAEVFDDKVLPGEDAVAVEPFFYISA